MPHGKIYQDVTETVGNTPLIRLNRLGQGLPGLLMIGVGMGIGFPSLNVGAMGAVAAAGVNRASPAGSAAPRTVAATFAIASARAASVPGLTASHSSALRPVRSCRGDA